MKKIILTIVFAVAVLSITSAQEIKTLPTNQKTANLPNGWQKFELQGATFDVEVIDGSYTQGNVTWFDGSSYSGSLNGHLVSGRGTYKWTNGVRYEGSFKAGVRHGKGSLILANGQKWSGKWKNDKKNGKGKMFNAKGEILQEGVWENDKFIKK